MNTLKLKANAKINIGLQIISKRPDGYHNIETVFYPIELCDDLIIKELSTKIKEPSLKIKGLPIAGEVSNNLCIKAWNVLKQEFPTLPAVEIKLDKKIPIGAGLGGGSSDAAQVLLGLKTMFNLNISDEKLALLARQLGADVPFFLYNKPVFATGIGDIFEPIELDLSKYEIEIFAFPHKHSDTATAYKNISQKTLQKKKKISLKKAIKKPIELWKYWIENDFEEEVFRRLEKLRIAKQFLYLQGAIFALMTGSGSALFGISKK